MDITDFEGKKVLVMGLGRFGGGLDCAIFASGAGAHVTVTDLSEADAIGDAIASLEGYDIEYHLGGHESGDFLEDGADIIIVNPAVPPENKFVQMGIDSGRVVTSQVEIFFELCAGRIVGITGANGKSTTAALTAHVLEEGRDSGGYGKVWLSGNIGNRPLLRSLDQIGVGDVVVLELSSFQLEQLGRIKRGPEVSVITNLTPNHLDRHGTFEAYCDAKENIFRYQRLDEGHRCVSIFNAEDAVTSGWYERYRGQAGRECVLFNADDVCGEVGASFTLPGRANRSNLAAVLKVAGHFGVGEEAICEALKTFRSLSHRLELVAEIGGVRWYDDSISTTPVSSIAAMDAFDCPRVIIAGGYDKDLPFDELGAKIAACGKGAVLIGKTAGKIAEAIEAVGSGGAVRVEFADSMGEAVRAANEMSCAGDVVLMSPACASYDMFDNFRHRSEVFIEEVNRIKGSL